MNVNKKELGKRSNAPKMLRNFLTLSGSKIFGDAFTLVLFVTISRIFGQEGIGKYSFAMALTGFFALLADYGLYEFSIKEMSRSASSMSQFFKDIFFLRIVLSAIVFGLLIVVIAFLPFSEETKGIVVLVGLYQIIYVMLSGFLAVFIADGEMHLSGAFEVSLRVGITFAGSLVAFFGGSLLMMMTSLPLVTFATLFLARRAVLKKHGCSKFEISHWAAIVPILRKATPFMLYTVLQNLAMRLDIVCLGFFLGVAETGVYNTAYRVVQVLLYLSYFSGLTLLPLASQLFLDSKEELHGLYQKMLNLNIMIGMPSAVGLWLIGPDLIDLIFGSAFLESGTILGYLAWIVLFAALRNIMETFLIAMDMQVGRTKRQWAAALINLFGNIILIPTVGILGAAIATLVSEAVLVVLFVLMLNPILGFPRVGLRLSVSIVASGSFVLVFKLILPSSPLALVIPGSIIIYAFVSLLFKEIRDNELYMLNDLLRGKSFKMVRG